MINQQQVVELPLNGRQATSLILLAGAATLAPAGDLNTNKNYPTVTISVAGGLNVAAAAIWIGFSPCRPNLASA